MSRGKKKTIREEIVAMMKLTIIANLIRGLRTNAEIQEEDNATYGL